MKKRMVGQTKSWSVILTIALALFNLGLFGIILLSGNQLSKIIRQNFEIQIYMNKDFDRTQVRDFLNSLSSKPFIAPNPEGMALRFVSKEEAGQQFMNETGEDFAQFLGENPLRDAITCKVAEPYLETEKLKAVKQEILAMPGVFEVVYIESLIGSIQENLARVSIIFIAISFLLLITVIWLIRNTIRLSIYAQRFLIRSMELVGAEPWFIQKPYIGSMFRQGLWGGIFAVIFLLVGLHFIGEYFPPFRQVIVPEQVGILFIVLLGIGGLLGGICSWLSVRKFLGRKLDELHVY